MWESHLSDEIYVSRVHGNWTYVLTMLLNGDCHSKKIDTKPN